MKDTRWAAVAAAVVAVLLVGAAGFAVGRSTGGPHGGMSSSDMGHEMGSMGGSGDSAWTGGMMDMGGMPGMSMGADGTMRMSDRAFLAMMIPHHRMAVEMAKIELDRGSDPAALAMARRVVSDQEREIRQMRDWYRRWFGADPPSMPMSGAMASMGMTMDMDELRSTDEPDRVFLRMMIPHHAGAILMSDMTLAGDPRAEVRDLARRIVATQAVEIGDMQRVRERIAPPLG
jgi:uncharacterized protein (DUF305 family)